MDITFKNRIHLMTALALWHQNHPYYGRQFITSLYSFISYIHLNIRGTTRYMYMYEAMRALTILFITLQFVKGAIKVFKSHIKVIHCSPNNQFPLFIGQCSID